MQYAAIIAFDINRLVLHMQSCDEDLDPASQIVAIGAHAVAVCVEVFCSFESRD